MTEPAVDEDDDPVRWIGLRPDAYAGPFREKDGVLGDDVDDLHRWTGISRELYDEVMAWNEAHACLRGAPSEAWRDRHHDWQQRLLSRMREEVHPGIEVQAPQAERPTEVSLTGLRPEDVRGRRVLDALGAPLAGRVVAWVERGVLLWDADRTDDVAVHDWEDAGAALAREVQEALGPGYEVVAR
ncbi:hypothetical protein ENKNEFLB_03964 [Nocardioides aquaticus]|uniref:Uncharacterized protein n=1 Tax=Nocardioides aquaticus TaxID=160826 RepID=A0ABX8EM02_9ACTN|nr:hypothetical protein [Nocardioides aquaticus]QVT81554.1 hypothetical protein ENKNEFLB_03964 [Nocardioides aquaticus]